MWLYSVLVFWVIIITNHDFWYDKEKLIDENYDYNKDIEIKNNQLSSSNYRGYGYTLVSSQLWKIPRRNEIKYYLRQSKYNNKRILLSLKAQDPMT